MLLHSLKLHQLLSYGPDACEIQLKPLNVLIGPNGSGKSNLLEAIGLLSAVPEQLAIPIREGGGVSDWLWKGNAPLAAATLSAVIDYPSGRQPLRYELSFAQVGQGFEIIAEKVEAEHAQEGKNKPYFFYELVDGRPALNLKGQVKVLNKEDLDFERSILAQRRDPEQFPELTYLAQTLGKMRLYREWSFGRYTAPRMPQKADLPNDYLRADAGNLGLVLNRLRRDPQVKARLLKALRKLYSGIEDYEIVIEGGTVQVFLQEGQTMIPATRLSDGTLRYLCLLAILCHPNPPPLVCIEEPELGLHPDMIPVMAELLLEASAKCQLIVTTHSDILLDALSETPEAVLVCEKRKKGTAIRRLQPNELSTWLEKYQLGALWLKGEIGGKRW